MKHVAEKNKFFDINKLPKGWGLLVFPISMSKVSSGQNAKNTINFLRIINKKTQEPKIGVTFVYGDYLYFHSQKPAAELKSRFQELVIDHKNGVLKSLTGKYRHEMQITPAFTFATWNQMYLWADNFKSYFNRLQKIAEKDKNLQQCLKDDAKAYGRKLTKHQINFLLEEALMAYLAIKGKIQIYNEYVHNRETWIMWCYPGKPPKTQVYLFQKNIFNLKNPENGLEHIVQYDLESNVAVTYDNIDLETYSVK